MPFKLREQIWHSYCTLIANNILRTSLTNAVLFVSTATAGTLDMVLYCTCFSCSKSMFSASRQGTGRHYITWLSYPPIAKPVLLLQRLATHVFLAEHWCWQVNKQNVQYSTSTWHHLMHWLTLSSSFCMACRHKFKICIQTVRCGQKVNFDLRFCRKPVSSSQACYSVTDTLASKPSVMSENWTQQHVTRWGVTWAR